MDQKEGTNVDDLSIMTDFFNPNFYMDSNQSRVHGFELALIALGDKYITSIQKQGDSIITRQKINTVHNSIESTILNVRRLAKKMVMEDMHFSNFMVSMENQFELVKNLTEH